MGLHDRDYYKEHVAKLEKDSHKIKIPHIPTTAPLKSSGGRWLVLLLFIFLMVGFSFFDSSTHKAKPLPVRFDKPQIANQETKETGKWKKTVTCNQDGNNCKTTYSN